MQDRKKVNTNRNVTTTLQVLSVLVNLGESARLRYCQPNEKINYILEASASYDLPLSKKIAQIMSENTCNLQPGLIPGQTTECTELFDLGNTLSIDKIAKTTIRVLSCPVEPLTLPSPTDTCLINAGQDEYNRFMNGPYFYFLIGMMLVAAGVFTYSIYKCLFDTSKYCMPCNNVGDIKVNSRTNIKK